MERKDLEHLLSEILVPVSPSDTFLRRLKARLVIYRGANPINPWSIVVVAATSILILAAGLGLFLRVLIGWIGLLGLLNQRERSSTNADTVSVS